MALVNVYNKSRDITYVYESKSYWDKDLKQPRSIRKLIGKRDPETGEIIPTGKRGRKPSSTTSPDTPAELHDDTDYRVLYEKAQARIEADEKTILDLRQRLASATQECRDLRKATSKAFEILGNVLPKQDILP